MSIATKLLTIDDLAERWGCNARTAWERVKEKGIPFVWLGKGEFNPSGHGPKLVRFRPRVIEEWEAAREKVHEADAPAPAAAKAAGSPAGMPAWWDGKVRGGAKTRKK